jgi:DNA-binding transcriptional ArsR family regulator
MTQVRLLKRARVAEPSTILPADDARDIARFFQVLADPTRVRIVKALADAEWCVTDLTLALGMDQPAVSHQLKYLREQGLVTWTKHGRHVYYTLCDDHLRDILDSSISHIGCMVASR